jgi:NAD dependent epimerase/dehydratase family enzyme
MIQSRVQTTPQLNMIERVEQALAQLLADASRRGFYGEAGLTLSIQDGRIQHIRVAIERMIK